MPGLIFLQRLQLNISQWIILADVMLLYILGYYFKAGWKVSFIAQPVLLFGFLNKPIICMDTHLLFHAAKYLQKCSWKHFVTEFVFLDYVHRQPPFVTFIISRIPILWVWQCINCGLAIAACYFLYRRFGSRALLLCATPVFLLMSTQPGNDFMLFVYLAGALCLLPTHKAIFGAAYGFSFLIKPLMLLIMPFVFFRIRGYLAISIVIIFLYYLWSTRYYFGNQQWEFLFHQLGLRALFAR